MEGLVLINKPKGYTSHDIVSIVKKKLNINKVGHTGTLDPLATGVLPILIGEGTKLCKYLINHDKEYIASIKLGIKTDTGDCTGKILKEEKVKNIDKEEILKVIKSFIGKQKQKPPMYSAIKVNGKKLYEYARNNEEVEIEERDIEIYNIELLEINNDVIKLKISCSKGTYIRTLCENISEELNTIGTMIELERTKVGSFSIEDAISLNDLEKEYIRKIITSEKLFEKSEIILLEEETLKRFLNGVLIEKIKKDGIYRIYDINNQYIGLGIIKNNLLKREYIV